MATAKRIPGRYAAKAGVPKRVSCHSFRHYYITYLIRRGVATELIAKNVGHERTEQTNDYADVVPIDLQDAYRRNMEGW